MITLKNLLSIIEPDIELSIRRHNKTTFKTHVYDRTDLPKEWLDINVILLKLIEDNYYLITLEEED